MSRLTALAAVAMLGAGFTATWLWQHRQRAPAALLQASASVPMPQTAEPVVTTTVLAAPVQAASAQAASDAPLPPTSAAAAYDIAMRKLNPNYIGVVNGKSGAMQLAYPDLARELNITSQQAEALYDLLMKHQAELSGLRGVGSDATAMLELERARAELLARQKSELDAAIAGREQQWQEYQPTLDARRRVSELTNMVATTSPLSDAQARLLVATVVREQRIRADEQAARGTPADNPLARLEFAEQNQTSREQSNRRTVDAMRSHLTEQQLTIMENAMDGMNRQIRASLQAERARLEAGNPR